MRRKWPVLAAAVPLAFGSALATAHPAAASTVGGGLPGPGGQVQPGGPVSQLSQPGDQLSQPGGVIPGAPTGIVTPRLGNGQAAASSGGSSSSSSSSSQAAGVTSSNWAGYAATGASGTFTSVFASWTQPTASCATGNKYAAFWVGLDGYTSKTVEQIGTEADCSGSTPVYYAWYEVYPGAGVNFTNPVSPGDKFTGSVTSQGSGKFQLVLKDTTQGWTQTINATQAGTDLSSAEAIAEAPSGTAGGSSVLPLTDFGSVGFTGVTVNGKSMATFNPTQITMPDTSATAMTSDGSFTVNYAGTGFPEWFGF